jgi:protein FAM161A
MQSDITETEKSSMKHRDDNKSNISITPAPIYPVNRPNLAATLRFQVSRKKLQRLRDNREVQNRENLKRPTWGVRHTHAFQQLRNE